MRRIIRRGRVRKRSSMGAGRKMLGERGRGVEGGGRGNGELEQMSN